MFMHLSVFRRKLKRWNSVLISECNSNRKAVGIFQRMQKEDGGCGG